MSAQVLVASKDDDTVAWHENDGEESFTERIITTTADYVYSVFAADVDGSGTVDVLSASHFDDTIALYANDGSQSFTEHIITTTAEYASSVVAKDVNGDGFTDAVSARFQAVDWHQNDGSESFTTHEVASMSLAKAAVAADLDGDGDVDLLSADENTNKVAWHENDGAESFAELEITTLADGARDVQAADVDGDGDLDALAAAVGIHTVACQCRSCFLDARRGEAEFLGRLVRERLLHLRAHRLARALGRADALPCANARAHVRGPRGKKCSPLCTHRGRAVKQSSTSLLDARRGTL